MTTVHPRIEGPDLAVTEIDACRPYVVTCMHLCSPSDVMIGTACGHMIRIIANQIVAVCNVRTEVTAM